MDRTLIVKTCLIFIQIPLRALSNTCTLRDAVEMCVAQDGLAVPICDIRGHFYGAFSACHVSGCDLNIFYFVHVKNTKLKIAQRI